MAIFTLTEWEDNGYHDSYFNEAWWNTETQQVEFHEVGATAYAGGDQTPRTPINDPAELEKAIAWLAEKIFDRLKVAEHNDVLNPDVENLAHGREFRLLRSARNKGVKYEAGTVGEMVRQSSFGAFYRNGYNRPNRENTRVTLRLIDGTFATFALSALRQHREPLTDDELRAKAAELAQHCQFSQAGPYKFAWDTKNHAKSLKEKQAEPMPVAA